ncbi:recombinase family protein [Streptomyces sp. Marseille-Q5077]|uniref:recombinase family protein n=1 Tax=Streptomyces sp. Marseille-Q5077 TaxID=3418995 RepID=UPI003CFD2128
MIRAWCRQQGHTLGRAVFRDEGYSGTLHAPDRPALADALSEVEDGQAAGIVVGRLDRLARRLVTQEAILAQVWKNNRRVFTADQGEILQDDPEDPMRTAMRQHLGGQLARLEVAECGLEVVADDALGPLVRRLVELGDAQPSFEQERHGHLRLGVAVLVHLVEEPRADLLGLDLRLGLLVEVQILLRERVSPGVDPDLEAGSVGADAAALTSLVLGVRHGSGTYSWLMPWLRRTARLPQRGKRAGQTRCPRQDSNLRHPL